MSRSFKSYVALGDSWTEGVGDPDETRPNGIRGWADLVAEAMARNVEEFRYANLAVRGRILPDILAEQLEPALAMRPDIVSLHGAGNDFFKPKVDIDALVESIDDATARLTANGSTVVLFTHGNGGTTGVIGRLRGRMALFNELLREVVDRHDALLVDNWRMHDGMHPHYWSDDRIHLSTAGHVRQAIYVLETLGIEHDLAAPVLPTGIEQSRRDRLNEDLDWAKKHLGPWVKRRIRRESAGDDITARYPDLTPFRPR